VPRLWQACAWTPLRVQWILPYGKALPPETIDKEVVSCCQFCQVRCTTTVQVREGRVVNVYGRPENE